MSQHREEKQLDLFEDYYYYVDETEYDDEALIAWLARSKKKLEEYNESFKFRSNVSRST